MSTCKIIGVALLLCTGAWQSANAACFTLYSSSTNQVVYRSMTPPIDLSLPLHQTLSKLYPGTTLVFTSANTGCEVEVFDVQPAQVVSAQ